MLLEIERRVNWLSYRRLEKLQAQYQSKDTNDKTFFETLPLGEMLATEWTYHLTWIALRPATLETIGLHSATVGIENKSSFFFL